MISSNGDKDSDLQPEAWLEDLIDLVGNCIEAHSLAGPAAWRYWMEDDLNHLIFYPTTVKLIGGEWDGEEVLPGFSLDVQTLLSAFQEVEAVYWNSQGMGPYDDEGPRISIEGIYQGHDVWLRILAEPPEDEEPGMELDVSDFEY